MEHELDEDPIVKKDIEIKGRIRLIVANIGGNMAELNRRLDLTTGHLAMVMSTDSGISATFLKNLAAIGVNMNWLLVGEGNTIWRKDISEGDGDAAERILELENRITRSKDLVESLERMIMQK